MNGTLARQVFSASTAALTSRAIRRSAHPSRPFPFTTRSYSDQKSQPEDAVEPTPEPDTADASVESQIPENLKKKEAEVHDLTVSPALSSASACLPPSCRVDYGTSKPTF